MTYYKRYNEKQRNDPQLRQAVERELREFNIALLEAKALLEQARNVLNKAIDIEEDSLDYSSGIREAKAAITTAISRFSYKIGSEPTDTYIGNVAAAMNSDKAKELKEKYQ